MNQPDSIPSAPGTYVLALNASSPGEVTVGSFGSIQVQPGWYLYSGSALGPGGLHGRLSRHLRSTVCRWHIDYLKPLAPIRQIWYTVSPRRCEHLWAAALAALPGAQLPWPRFGASDCICPSHLFHFLELPSLERFIESIKQADPQAPHILGVSL
jgi:Uri superfamily endonuclease